MEGTSEDLSELRCWDNLMPDVLGLIFRRLSLNEVLTLVPCVCKLWREATLGPYCWQVIDIYGWSVRHRGQTEILDRMLEMLVIRSNGSCRKLCISGLPNDFCFSFIANHGKSLQMLGLKSGGMSDSIVQQFADRLLNLTYLDLSRCIYIGKEALEAFGNHCKSLSTLVRSNPSVQVGSQDEEANAIASTMPKLNRLEICYMRITTQSCLAILSHCRQLKHLDIRGCWDVKLDHKFVEKKYDNVNVIGPNMGDYFVRGDGDYFAFFDLLDDFDDYFDHEGFVIGQEKSASNA